MKARDTSSTVLTIGITSWLLACTTTGYASNAWFVGANTHIAEQTGLTADSLRPVLWRDTQINPTHPSQSLGLLEEIGVQQLRNIPLVQAHALFSFEGMFGSGPGQIPVDATIDRATLWFHVTSVSGSQEIGLAGLNVIDANWVESQATFNRRANGQAWSGGTFGQSLSGDFGRFSNPPASGWMSVEVTSAVRAFRTGSIGGIAFVASDVSVPDIRNFYFDSNQGSAPMAPGLHVHFTPVPEPSAVVLGGLAAIVSCWLLRKRGHLAAGKMPGFHSVSAWKGNCHKTRDEHSGEAFHFQRKQQVPL